jgi:hypothetical protein
MDITIYSAFLPHTGADAALAFYRDVLGFELRNDVGYDGRRWLTVSHPEPTEQPYGIRDCAVRDPAGNLLRINEVR